MASTTTIEFDHLVHDIPKSKFPIPSFYNILFLVAYKIHRTIHVNMELYSTTQNYYPNQLYTLWNIEDLDDDIKPDLNYVQNAFPIVATAADYSQPVNGIIIITKLTAASQPDEKPAFKYLIGSPIQRYIFFNFSYIAQE